MAGEEDSIRRISIHALLAESDGKAWAFLDQLMKFQSTLSLRRATCPFHQGDRTPSLFQSTLSLRRATPASGRQMTPACYFNPRSPCGERPQQPVYSLTFIFISIHALLAESDICWPNTSPRRRNFNPRSPCGERRAMQKTYALLRIFQSTLSLRRATVGIRSAPAGTHNFNPRSPCGERLSSRSWFIRVIGISIHALLAESDSKYHQIGPIVSV